MDLAGFEFLAGKKFARFRTFLAIKGFTRNKAISCKTLDRYLQILQQNYLQDVVLSYKMVFTVFN